jgi:nitroreductase
VEYVNPVILNIMARESYRQFKTDKVKREDIDWILKAGSYAPSAGGRQPWAFTVITNEEIINYIADESLNTFNASGIAPSSGTPGSNPEDIKKTLLEKRPGPPGGFKRGGIILGRDGFPPCVIIISETTEKTQDAASHLAAENIMLAAKSLGLDSLWMGAVNADVLQPALDKDDCPQIIKQLIPENHHLVCTIGIGYADWNAFRAPRVPRRTDNVFFFE